MATEKKVRVGIVGLGSRYYGMMEQLSWTKLADLVCVCDAFQDRVDVALDRAKEWYPSCTVHGYTDFHEMFEKEDIDGVYISTSWATHTEIAIDAMKHGIIPGIECGGANSVEECWELVRTHEATGTQCMFMENCCYGREEMTILRLVKMGLFGELTHCEGGYEHDLRAEIVYGRERRHYRRDNYLNKNADLYPAHALGPIMKFLNVNNGNRMLSLTSTASKAVSLRRFTERERGPQYDGSHLTYHQGDVVTTVIKCANGETITLNHDTSSARPYSRGGRVQGTDGIWMEDNASIYLDGISPKFETWEPFASYMDNPKYEHPLWTEFRTDGVKGGHGGMDFLVLSAFCEVLKTKCRPPLDVYDAAALMCITPLSEASIACGSAPVAIPDFTNGLWIKKREPVVSKYALDDIYPERYEFNLNK